MLPGLKMLRQIFLIIFEKSCWQNKNHSVLFHLCSAEQYARVAQLVERDLAKVEAAGSSPVSRS